MNVFKAGPTAPIAIAILCGENILPTPAEPELVAANHNANVS